MGTAERARTTNTWTCFERGWLARAGLALVLGACDASGPRSARLTDEAHEERFAELLDEMAQQGLSVIVANTRGRTVVRELGTAARDGNHSSATRVDLNSVTKTITALAVAALVEQGKARFSDPLSAFFPDAPSDKAGITLHQLLTHSAGFAESLGDDFEELDREAFLARAFASPLRGEPGRQYRYSNVGYSVLAAIIEQRSGKSYETFLRDELVRGRELVLGYGAAYADERSLRTTDGRAIREASWGGHGPFWNLIGNGGLVSTPESALQLLGLAFRGELLSPELLALAKTPHIAEGAGAKSHYGYGMVVEDFSNVGRVYWHDGGNGVFSAQWVYVEERGDLLFTAGTDEHALLAMRRLLRSLYDIRLAD